MPGRSTTSRSRFSNDELLAILRRACEFRQIRVENRQLKQDIRRKDKSTVSRPIGKSRRFSDVLKLAEVVAPTDSTVLIQGESGHRQGGRGPVHP
jgi:DNA-binding NtrC family response regulator